MATTIAELLIKMGVSVEGASAAETELEGVSKAATDVDKQGGTSLADFGKKAGKAFAVVGAAALAAAVGIFKLVDSVTSAGDEIIKGAKVAGLGTDEYQRLGFAAKISGTNIKQLSVASKTVALGMADAADKGTGPLVEGLELVGLRLEDVIDLPFEQQLGVFADAINGLDTESEKLAASQKLFGSRAGPQLATLLAEGSAGIKALGDEAAATGGVLGTDALEASAEFQDSIVRMKTAVGGIVNEIGIELAPVVQEMIDGFKQWTLENRDLIATNLRGFLQKVIPVIKSVANVIGTVIEAVGDFISLMGGAENALAVVTSGFIAFKMAGIAASGPLGAIATAFAVILPLALKLGDALGDILIELANLQDAERDIRQRKEKSRGGVRTTASIEDPAARKQAAILVQRKSELLAQLEGPGESRRGKSKDEQIAIGQRNTDRRKRISAEFDRTESALDSIFAVNPEVVAGAATATEKPADKKKPKRKVKRGKGKGKGKGAAAEPESDVTLAEALLAVRTGTADPRQLKKVIQQLARKTPSTKAIKPTVAIDFFNFVITQNFKGGNAMQVAKESATAIRGEFQKATARAGQSIPTGVTR